MSDIASRLAKILSEIDQACAQTGRDRDSVTLIAVSKNVPAERVSQLVMAGHRVFGENRVQEARAKWPGLREAVPQLELHGIGPVQTNKARDAVLLFDALHSVDRVSLCAALARQQEQLDRKLRVFVQVNTGMEAQKSGVPPGQVDRLVRDCRSVYGLDVVGLMCIPPLADKPDRHFALLADLAAGNGLKYLSMGMSSDFASAIRHGATHIRVGRAIFGERA